MCRSHTVTTKWDGRGGFPTHVHAYLLGLLAMIKCSICSYQCDN